tara:strand:+ start:233 stop:1033 length:801 start_codon:yes stop_codon:yes gene_type:complete
MHNSRVISWFSCGASSAFATYLAREKYSTKYFEAVYCRVAEEHEDNLRFLNDFEKKLNFSIKIIGDEKKDFSIFSVFKQRRFIKGPTGAPCTTVLKKDVRKKYELLNDIQIFGYTKEEEHRVERFLDANGTVNADFILFEKGYSKKDCLEFIRDLNIEIPIMYRLGYNNNNCVGCVKGGMGYWNKIRIDFPEAFNRMAKLEREIGHAINKDKNGPVYLDKLNPKRGRFKNDLPNDCGFTCEMMPVKIIKEKTQMVQNILERETEYA